MNNYSTIRLSYFLSMFENDSDMIIEILSACLLQCEVMKNVISRSCDEHDIAALNRVAHQLKPTMHYLGVESVYEQLNSLEVSTAKHAMQSIGIQTNRSLTNIIVDLKLALRQFSRMATSGNPNIN
jgi:chemotaxis protein histidine kinase CheA